MDVVVKSEWIQAQGQRIKRYKITVDNQQKMNELIRSTKVGTPKLLVIRHDFEWLNPGVQDFGNLLLDFYCPNISMIAKLQIANVIS